MIKKICAWRGVALLTLLLNLSILICLYAFDAQQRTGVVLRVIDGDTFVFDTGEHIRLIGINSPEYEPWKNRVDFFGKEAAAFAKKILNQKKVSLESDIEPHDRYGRTLAYVYLENGQMVNQILVEEGFARAKYYSPNGRYRESFNQAQKNARKLKKGLWSVSQQS